MIRIVLWLAALFVGAPAFSAETLMMDKREVVVNAPIEKVWEAFTTTEGISSWAAPGGVVDLRVGGAFELYFDPKAPPGERGMEGTKVLSFVPMQMISFSGSAPPNFPTVRKEGGPWSVVWFAPADDGKTKLTWWAIVPDRGEEYRKAFAHAVESQEKWMLPLLQKRFTSGPIDWAKLMEKK